MYVLEGTWEEIKQHERELSGQNVRVIVKSEAPASHTIRSNSLIQEAPRRISAMGKYAGVLSSEEFLLHKKEDIALEDRSIR